MTLFVSLFVVCEPRVKVRMLSLDNAGRRRPGEHARTTVGSNGHWPTAEHERILERIEQNLQRCNQDGG